MKLTASIMFLFAFGLPLTAQKNEVPRATPGFAGFWEAADSRPKGPLRNRLVITQTENTLEVKAAIELFEIDRSASLVLYTDGRGKKNQVKAAAGTMTISSTSKWKKDKIVRKMEFVYSQPVSLLGDTRPITVRETETYSLSKDGDQLTIENVSVNVSPVTQIARPDPQPKIIKRVFRRFRNE